MHIPSISGASESTLYEYNSVPQTNFAQHNEHENLVHAYRERTPVRSSLLTASFMSPLRKAMKLSGILERIPSSSVGNTSIHDPSTSDSHFFSRRERRSIGNAPRLTRLSNSTRNSRGASAVASGNFSLMEIKIYFPQIEHSGGSPLELEVHDEVTVKEAIPLALEKYRETRGTLYSAMNSWILRPIQDDFVDYENEAPDPLDRVRLLDTLEFALLSDDSDSEAAHHKRPTHRRCYTLPSNGKELLDMNSNAFGIRMWHQTRTYRIRIGLDSAEVIQVNVYSHSSEIRELAQCACKKLYWGKPPENYGLLGRDVRNVLRPIPATRRVLTFAEHTEFVLVCLKDKESGGPRVSGFRKSFDLG
ncbi:hypothetical protein Moror_12533 [Moniliophthora roreri MCA 2997]|uniref:CRIM domain-containing protein n=1 Tax=Moniliophthora roreri (strain MCA 2997) TaxID=1381753 RepID=V2XS55_MONRO|nr:hypothetical protein Moror_12533 [Moniliophthora roreri MCA 2997]